MGANDYYLDERGLPAQAVAATTRAQELQALEDERVKRVALRKMFVNGTQYDVLNYNRAKALQLNSVVELPEHEKLHAYSTQIQESVEFIASQMADGFHFEAKDSKAAEVLLAAMRRSPALRGGDTESDISITNVLRDALEAQDTPVRIRWDPIDLTAWPEFWPSEKVRFDYDPDDDEVLERVVTRKWVWARNERGDEEKRQRRTEWYIEAGEATMAYYWEGTDEPYFKEKLGLPFIPWTTLRVLRKSTSSPRGESVITDQAIHAAMRYNAVEQTGFLIARYNSHGNLAVIGDSAALKAQMDERINKDVADILTFPGGTALQVLQLPTDATMVEHQREVLLDAMYGAFGLTRLDTSTVQGLGQLSGYALEILNRKTTGTFNRIRNEYVGDFKRMLDLILDVTAYKQNEPEELTGLVGDAPLDVPVEEVVFQRMMQIDPLNVFPNREYTLTFGSGYVVDRVMLRDDFTAGLISRAEALRQSGKSKKEIDDIAKEIEDEKPAQPEVGMNPGNVSQITDVLNRNKQDQQQQAGTKAGAKPVASDQPKKALGA